MSDDNWDYTYDAEGNLTKKVHVVTGETWTYGYDHRNQMVWAEKRASDGGLLLLSAEFKYDVFGNRIEKTLDLDADGFVDDTERYAYDGFKPGGGFVGNENWDIWADLDINNALVTRYIRGDNLDELVARVDAFGNIDWYFPDHQGSLRHITDNLGLVIADIAYNAFGIITSESNPNETGRHTYTGREWDPSLGLYYYRARYYDAETGRWTTQDPLGFAAGDANFYRYVGNNATNATDPSGNEPITVIVVGGTMLALAGIGGLLYTAARYDYASEHYMGMSAAEWTPEIQDEFSNYVMTSRYIAAGSYVAAQTGISMVGAPLFGYGMGYAWGAWGLAGKLGVLSFTGIGIGGLVYEGYNIVRDWNQMDGPQRFERVGLLAGPTLVGLRYGPRFFRSGLRDGWARPVSTRGWTPQTHTGRAGPLSHTGRPGPLPHTGRPGPLPHTGRPGPGVAPRYHDGGGTLGSWIQRLQREGRRIPNPNAPRPVINTRLQNRVTQTLPEGQVRTPTETAQTRNFFERNRQAAREWWEQRTGRQWPTNSTHDEHPRAIANGGDPLYIEPGFGGPRAPHMVPGPDGLTDFQRWGQRGGRPRRNN